MHCQKKKKCFNDDSWLFLVLVCFDRNEINNILNAFVFIHVSGRSLWPYSALCCWLKSTSKCPRAHIAKVSSPRFCGFGLIMRFQRRFKVNFRRQQGGGLKPKWHKAMLTLLPFVRSQYQNTDVLTFHSKLCQMCFVFVCLHRSPFRQEQRWEEICFPAAASK